MSTEEVSPTTPPHALSGTTPPVTVPAIELEDVEVVYRVRGIDRSVLRGVSLTIDQGESYGLVGESGCGKTTAAFAIMRHLPRNGRVVSGSIRVNGEDLMSMEIGRAHV